MNDVNVSRQARRRDLTTARRQRKRKRRLFGLTSKIQARRHARILHRLFGYGPGCQVREHHNDGRLNRTDRRFMTNYATAMNGEKEAI